MRRITIIHRPPRRNAALLLLDRVIGDALVAAMLILGFAFCLGAARAAEGAAPGLAPSMHDAAIPVSVMDLQR